MPERAGTAALLSYRHDDAQLSPVKPQRLAGGRSPDPEREFERQFEELASRWCTLKEIAAVMGLRPAKLSSIIKDRYGMLGSEALERFQERGRASLRRLQWHHAQESVAMAIFLGKNTLGQSDIPKDSGSRPPVNIVVMPAALNPGDWQVQMSQLEATRGERVAKAMEAAGLLLEDGEEDALELPVSSAADSDL